jgi:hypothetical protein
LASIFEVIFISILANIETMGKKGHLIEERANMLLLPQ